MTDYLVLDVFTDTPFGGNQLAVIPDATTLPETQLQSIAAEFNFSETVFLYPPENPANTARLRIFTPTMEIPFAGHPTIGAAVALAKMGNGPEMVLELGVGPLHATATEQSASFTTKVPLKVLAHPPRALVARALGLEEAHIASHIHEPALATLGLPFTLTELVSREALSSCQTDITAFRTGAAEFEGALDFAQFAYVRKGSEVHARMFAPLDNISEDPATGSACATLGAYLCELYDEPLTLNITQGADMGRPSQIKVEAGPQGVRVTGAAAATMKGTLLV